ncbi:unnamed protein product [Dibothriocephalus latus]|uniref:DH domain-containing protein n=1 Tax=Dibothriocephalus latus TaxID=60516 RepID=A0A3P7NWR4_DIBLA|nr:unnamed protein product [Dibothriocephalus latus]
MAKRTPSNAVKIDPVSEQENIYVSLENATSYGERKPKTSTESSLRAFLLDELIDNETKFKKEMVLILCLLSSGDIDIPISVEDFMSIFINLPEYVSVSKEIINAFTNVKENSIDPELTCVAGAFLPIISRFKKAYVDYIKHFDPQLVQKRPHLEKYFEVASAMLTKEDNNNSSLSDRLLTPFQRPFKISNVFERMKKNLKAAQKSRNFLTSFPFVSDEDLPAEKMPEMDVVCRRVLFDGHADSLDSAEVELTMRDKLAQDRRLKRPEQHRAATWCTPKGHPDHENLTRVLTQMQDLIATADRIKRPGSELLLVSHQIRTNVQQGSAVLNACLDLSCRRDVHRDNAGIFGG